MPGAGGSDKYANVLYDSVTQSATDTLTFEAIEIGLSLFDKVGILIHRLEWFGHQAKLAADNDTIEFGLSTSNGWSAADSSEPSIITFHKESVVDYGTAATCKLQRQPLLDDFTTLPGGGILTTPKPLYLFCDSDALAAAATVKIRLFFTIVTLKAEEYFELLETRQFFG